MVDRVSIKPPWQGTYSINATNTPWSSEIEHSAVNWMKDTFM